MSGKSTPVSGSYLLERFPGKGGWTFVRTPEIQQQPNTPFGWVRVSGEIDGYALERVKLMPMGDGSLFLPVKAAIRKQIKKEAGDIVALTLWLDELNDDIPEEIKDCLLDESKAVYEKFCALTKFERNILLNPVYDAKSEEEKADQIVEMIRKLV